MRARMLRLVSPAAILVAAALLAGAAAAADALPLPEEAMEIAERVAGAAETAGRQHGDVTSDPAVAATGDIGATPPSRLLQNLSDRAAPPASDPTSSEPRAAGFDAGAGGFAASGGPGGSPVSGSFLVPGSSPVLHGCPRALLNALLAGAADTNDAVAALAIERETLALCRERQEVVNGIVALESELGTLLAEARATVAEPVAGAVGSTVSETPIVKESELVRVVSLPPPTGVAGEAPEKADAPADPAPPSYFWFSIIGTAGELRAGIGDGTSVWFVREGDRLPGAVVIEEIQASPPSVSTRRGVDTGRGVDTRSGVRADGAGKALLPYRPLVAVAGAAAGRQGAGKGP